MKNVCNFELIKINKIQKKKKKKESYMEQLKKDRNPEVAVEFSSM